MATVATREAPAAGGAAGAEAALGPHEAALAQRLGRLVLGRATR